MISPRLKRFVARSCFEGTMERWTDNFLAVICLKLVKFSLPYCSSGGNTVKYSLIDD